jgi:hypothetical protein
MYRKFRGGARHLSRAHNGLGVLLLLAACGIADYLHEVPHHDSADDFAPVAPSEKVDTRPAQLGPEAGLMDAAAAVDAMHVATTNDASATDAAADDASALSQIPRADAAAAADGGKPEPEPDLVAMAPPFTPDITLGATPLRKEDVLAFILLGHSNLAGSARDPAERRPYHFTETHPRAWKYRVGMPPEPALEPTARLDDVTDQAGPGVALLKQAAERAPEKHFVGLGFGKIAAYCSQFLPGSVYYEAATTSAIAIKGRVTFAAIVIMLGSTEKHLSEQ